MVGLSRANQYRQRKAACASSSHQGRLVEEFSLPSEDETSIDLALQNPLAMLVCIAKSSELFSLVLTHAQERWPCTANKPWRVIIYEDGVNPSDGLSKNHSRNSHVYYWSIAEFGMEALAIEEMWLALSICRCCLAKKVVGGVPRLTGVLMESFLKGRGSCDGIDLVLHCGRMMTIYLDHPTIILADAPALKEMISSKGHSGTKPCTLCKNCCSNVDYCGDSSYAVHMSETDIDKFEAHTDTSIRELVQRLQVRKLECRTIEEWVDVQSFYGFTWNPYSIILNERLNVKLVSSLMYDYGHIYVCDGLADEEMGRCMHALRKTASTYADCGQYVRMWTLPKMYSKLDHLFTPAKAKSHIANVHFNCIASEFLTLAPILYRYFLAVCLPRGHLVEHVRSMLLVLRVVRLLELVKYGLVTAAQLRAAIVAHLNQHRRVYGDSCNRPKRHYAIHLPKMLAQFGFLLSTLTHERKHRVFMRHVRERKNTTKWEVSVLEEMTCHDLHALESATLGCRLGSERSQPTKLQLALLSEVFSIKDLVNMQISNIAFCHQKRASAGDMVLFKKGSSYTIGEFKLGLVLGERHEALVSCYEATGDRDDSGVRRFHSTGVDSVVPIESFVCAVCYLTGGKGSIHALIPIEYNALVQSVE